MVSWIDRKLALRVDDVVCQFSGHDGDGDILLQPRPSA